jgi:hypothetical protein
MMMMMVMMMVMIIIIIIQSTETVLYCYVVIYIHYIRSEKKFAHAVHCVILCPKKYIDILYDICPEMFNFCDTCHELSG